MEDNEKLLLLELENARLREQVEALEQQLTARRRKKKFLLLRLFVRTYATKPLYASVTKLVHQAADRQIDRETIRDVIYAALRRLTRVGAITMLIALAPLTMAILQTYYLKKQNEKFDIQNKRIEQQTYLQEAERRSSLVFLFDNVLDKIDDELRANPGRRDLSPQLVGRIVALTKALKPYRYLEGDSITAQMTSPERGQVLLSLLASQLSTNTYDQIFLLADFSYTTLSNVNLDGAYLRNINLAHASLESVSLTGADLRQANLEEADIRGAHVQWTGLRARPARFDFANFHKARVINCDLGGSTFAYANFSGASLRNIVFQRSFFSKTKFESVEGDSLDFKEATVLRSTFSPVNSGQTGVWTFDSLQIDTQSFNQIRRLPLQRFPELDRARRSFRIDRDSFYVDDKKRPFVVVDSVEVYGTKN